ncbi:MAG TPA: helix-turn-helix transcriptional regulator [Pyrinomonadaceae bacterium]|nr:helix-turn-helix transcriptional regulator [Pyrinomonadaceae bacterium]
MIRVEIKPELLSWARERAGLEVDALSHRFPKITAWENGTVRPTLKQVEDFAKATHTPVGFLFLEERRSYKASILPRWLTHAIDPCKNHYWTMLLLFLSGCNETPESASGYR